MPIPKKIKADELVGRKVTLDIDIENRSGEGISKGSEATISSAHYGIEIKTSKCDCCGQYSVISRVSRNDLTLVEQ
jgi:hypothetical protein